jgi:hypothetical protein
MNPENPYKAPASNGSPPATGWKAMPENVRRNTVTTLFLFSMALLQLINIALNGIPRLPISIFFLYAHGPALAVFFGSVTLFDIWGWVGTVKGLRKWVWLSIVILFPAGYLLYLLYSRQLLE